MPRRPAQTLGPVAAVTLVTAGLLTGCSQTVHLDASDFPHSDDPACADVTVRLPNEIAGQERRWTDAQATGAYGSDQTSVILGCGVEVPGPTAELQCINLEGIDWLVDDAEFPYLRMTTYGRDPAVQVFVDTETLSSNEVLSNRTLVSAVRTIPAERSCIAPDTLDGLGETDG